RRLQWGDDYDQHGRTPNPMIDVPLRVMDFKREVETGFTKTLAYKEAKRCYQCQLNIIIDGQMCILCNACVDICPMKIIEMIPLERIAALDGRTDIAQVSREEMGPFGAAMLIDGQPGSEPGKVEGPITVLVVAAHPDDPEFGCGGTSALWASQGKEVYYVVCTSGDKGSSDPEMTSQKLVKLREAEQQAAADAIGV